MWSPSGEARFKSEAVKTGSCFFASRTSLLLIEKYRFGKPFDGDWHPFFKK